MRWLGWWGWLRWSWWLSVIEQWSNLCLTLFLNRLPPHVSNETSLDGMIYTKDMPLYQVIFYQPLLGFLSSQTPQFQTGLPPFPPLPGHTDPKLVEEIRRTLVVLGVSKETTAQEVMQYFGNGAGEVIFILIPSHVTPVRFWENYENRLSGEIFPLVHQGWCGSRERWRNQWKVFHHMAF